MDDTVLTPEPEQKSYWGLIWTLIFVILMIPGVILLAFSEIIAGVICRVPKLFRQETSPQFMVKLTDKKIKWAVEQVINNGETTEMVAAIYGVSRRRIQQLVKYYMETGDYPILDKKRRPKTHLSDDEKQIIEDAYNVSFLGARLLRYHIQKHYKRNISHNKIHQHLLEVGQARHNRKKQKKRKRCRYERKHSLSLVHADWLDYEGTQVIAYEDDASSKILSIAEFTNATTDNAIGMFKRAEAIAKAYRVKITAVNTDRGSQFHSFIHNSKKIERSYY